MWKKLSEELREATAAAARGLIHVGGEGVPGRTALVWSDGVALTLARQARDGESVPVVLPGGGGASATVRAWDARTGLAALSVPGVVAPVWTIGPMPAVGSLSLTVAYPSPQGPEARLDLVRFAGGDTEWARGVRLEGYFQTDGGAYPGFSGAAVVDPEGALVGLVAENRAGNGGFVVSARDVARLAATLLNEGSPRQAWLGVSTRPAGGQGLVLVSVDSGSPADRAGWRAGDLLLTVGDRALREPADLVAALAGLAPDREVAARVLRNGEVHEWPVTPTARR